MDEVDKIIIQSLKQIGCEIEHDDDSEVFRLQHFTPDLLVRAVSKCLKEINKGTMVPKALPENIAQRFTVATSLAEMCSVAGYRGDIGYQTFLYPNELDIRRLFMFLIEQLPKEQIGNLDDLEQQNKDDFDLLILDIRKDIMLQLKSPWVPQYCRVIDKEKSFSCSGVAVDFNPQLNLNIPRIGKFPQSKEESEVAYRIPNIFQQTSIGDYDLFSSVLHKNAIDVYAPSKNNSEQIYISRLMDPIFTSPVKHLEDIIDNKECTYSEAEYTAKSTLENILEKVETLKLQNHVVAKELETDTVRLRQLRQQRSEIEFQIDNMKKQYKVHKRTSVILENPEENINKLENLIEKTRERRLYHEQRWILDRNRLLRRRDNLQKKGIPKNEPGILELSSTVKQLKTALVEKNHIHKLLEDELQKASNGAALRNEYTRRIYEFIGNISKQRDGIYKILDDTKDLQKQLNSVSAQLHRQFNYTDDLLFQSAKHDLHAKQAYKLLAALHTSCDEICDLISRMGQMTKESRDLEVQIERERMRNVASSLAKINLDIQKFVMLAKSMKSEINQV